MADKVIRPAKSVDLSRAKSLQQALERGTPALFHPQDPPTAIASAPDFDSESLEVQRAYLEQLVESAPEAISILDNQHHILRVNAEFTRMFGFLLEEALGRRIDTLIVPPDRNSETRWVADSLSQGRKVALETKRQRN